jgi:penicillin-binding protein 1B
VAAELALKGNQVSRKALYVSPKASRKDLLRKFRIFFQIAIVSFAVLFTFFLAIISVHTYKSYRTFAQLIDQQIAGGYLRSHAGLYAAPRVVEKGARISKEQLASALSRAGYAPNRASNIWNGSFQVGDRSIRILPRQGTDARQWIEVTFDNRGRIASLSADDNSQLSSYSLEPELLTVDAGLKTGQQETLTYNSIPPVLVQAILAIEDRRFFEHSGVDIKGIGRAFLRWSTSGSLKYGQGGSTITQQLVKNTYLTPAKTLERKFNEAMIAVALEQRLSKQDIFALYCNEVYLGQRNGVGVRGVAQGARVYFNKDLRDLSVAEAATLAGMIQSPARYAPDRHPEASRARRDTVIAAMTSVGFLDAETSRGAQAEPISVAAFKGSINELAPYYVDAVNRAMENIQPNVDAESEQAIRVETTIDPDLQTVAETALRQQLERLDKSRRGKAQAQGAMVVLDPHTGHVLAMVGGRSYEESQLNRATDAKRQPGSVFKPIVYAAAFESGISPLSTYSDTPHTFEYDHATYSPSNYGGGYSMHDVMLREGLVRSLNVVTVDLAMRTGLTRVASTAERLGLPRPNTYPSMALGTFEATPLQLAGAYSAFANGGRVFRPTFVNKVVDNSTGETIADGLSPEEQVIKPSTAYMITDILSDVTRRGTARQASGTFKDVAIAGKTGTSRDGWFVGYTPNLVCAVWIGFDDNKQLGLTGAEAALPAWIDFMKEALAIRPSLGGSSFAKPSGIVSVKIDPESGELAGPNCPSSQIVSVAVQFAPRYECFKHLPEVEPVIDEMSMDLESNSDTDPVELHETEGLSDKTTPGDSQVEPETDPENVRQQPTEIDAIPSRAPRLVNAPIVRTQTPSHKVVPTRRP